MTSASLTQIEATTRRDFLKAGTAVIGGSLLAPLALNAGAYAGGSDIIRIGLVGCGGRGTGAAEQALAADPNVHLVALGDTFADRVESALERLQHRSTAGRIDVPHERRFAGFDAHKHVIEASDVVLLCTPPHFRPAHLKAAVAAGKHVFAEKPVAVDAPGVRSVMATAEEAKKKNLSVVSGLCYRYDLPKREVVKRIRDGAIGDIRAMHVSYNTGTLWSHQRQPDW